eukprot:scaffold185426_cov20-Prasinocladus_malaysianus.AAC.1
MQRLRHTQKSCLSLSEQRPAKMDSRHCPSYHSGAQNKTSVQVNNTLDVSWNASPGLSAPDGEISNA